MYKKMYFSQHTYICIANLPEINTLIKCAIYFVEEYISVSNFKKFVDICRDDFSIFQCHISD